MTTLIIHGHFYQPPRENPWTGIVETEPTAAPFHDWNERIHSECYAPNAFVQNGGEPAGGNYANISFNFGPTLLSWLQANHPKTYASILAADRQSILRHKGHGNAIAQAYGHAILPLCNQRDLLTQIRWGSADFRFRFARDPEALWLSETACNDKVMEALIAEGLRFVILAPHQAARIRPRLAPASERISGRSEWHDANEHTIDTSVAYSYSSPADPERSIAVFFYDGPISRSIAFESLLRSSTELVDRFTRAAGNGLGLLNLATDGETYGHHFKFGDICLAHALQNEAPTRGFQIMNYGEYLELYPPRCEVQINNGPENEGTSWSCVHGVGRWIRDCGCHTGGEPGWNQKWRGPLRQALDYLRDKNITYFEETPYFEDPWKARDDSVKLILDRFASREQFLYEHSGRWLPPDAQRRALTYLDLQHMLLLMYTSCGWFFNDISGIETIQILKYAGRALDLMNELGLPSAQETFLEFLDEAKSNRAELGTGADIFKRLVLPQSGLLSR